MKLKSLLLAMVAASTAFANPTTSTSTSPFEANQLEETLEEAAPAPSDNPWTITNNLTFHTNIHDVWEKAETSIHKDVFVNTLSGSKTFNLSDIGAFQTTYTPTVSAGYMSTNQGKDSDALDSASFQNKLSMKQTSGNTEYGVDLTAGYDYGYFYRIRKRSGNWGAFRRNDNNANGSIGVNSGIAITDNYKISATAGVKIEEYQGDRLPDYRFFDEKNMNTYRGHVGDDYDRTTYTAGIENQIIINDYVSISIPFDFARFDYDNFNAYGDVNNAAPVAGRTRLINLATAGVKANITYEMVEFSSGIKAGRWDDKVIDGEDSDYGVIETSALVNITDKLAMSATHSYEYWYYDTFSEVGDERYNVYGLGLTMTNIAGFPMDATVAHKLSKGQSNFDTGIYENNMTSLNLAFKL